MKALTHLCVALLCVILVSCGGKSAKTKGLSIDDLRAKLKSLRKPVDGMCTTCDGTGKTVDQRSGAQVTCPDCKGTGRRVMERGPTREEFIKTVGEPLKREDKDLIWEYWYYKCKEGTVRILAYDVEHRGDVARVVTGEVELVK